MYTYILHTYMYMYMYIYDHVFFSSSVVLLHVQVVRGVRGTLLYLQCFLSFELGHLRVIQCIGDLIGTFVNDESIIGNASLFFGVECTKTLIVRTIVRTPRMRDSPAFVFGSEKTG